MRERERETNIYFSNEQEDEVREIIFFIKGHTPSVALSVHFQCLTVLFLITTEL